MSEDSASSSTRSGTEDVAEVLGKIRARAGELIANLLRERADLEAHMGTDPIDKAEGLAALDEMIDAARRVMEDAR